MEKPRYAIMRDVPFPDYLCGMKHAPFIVMTYLLSDDLDQRRALIPRLVTH
jgi:hypothetical protein